MAPKRKTDHPDHHKYEDWVHQAIDEVLTHYEGCAMAACLRLQEIPKEDRPDWYANMLVYWKNVVSGIRWVKGESRRTWSANYAPDRTCPSGPDPLLPSRETQTDIRTCGGGWNGTSVYQSLAEDVSERPASDE